MKRQRQASPTRGATVPSNIDKRFRYDAHSESRGGLKQSVYGSEFTVIEPVNVLEAQPRQVDFDITTKRPILCEHNTKFIIDGLFEEKAEDGEWTPMTAAASANIMVVPNFFEQLIRSFEMYNDNHLIKTSDEPAYVGFFLNMYLYWSMNPILKKLLCPEPCHPGNGIPKKAKGWSFADGSEWREYAKHIFTGTEIRFSWVPLFVFPFFQGSNWILNETPPGCVPINHLGKFTFRLTFKDNWSSIFRKLAAVNNKSYRFKLTKLQLVVEEVRMNPSLERALYQTSKKTLAFPGVTRLAQAESPANGTYTHNVRFNTVYMPEGIFIFALNKNVVGGTYKFEDMAAGVYGPIFSSHNLIDSNVEFCGIKLALTEPNMFQVKKDIIDLKNMLDHIGPHAPFGMITNSDLFTLDAVSNGFENTDFPHVFYNLCVSGNDSTRIVPALTDDPGTVNKMGELFIQLKFADGGAKQDTVYIVYIYYSDVSMLLDLKNKRFYTEYELR